MTPESGRAAARVQCAWCRGAWPCDPALEVPCPACQAPAGVKCRRPSGHGCDLHATRDREALRLGIYARCPGPGEPTAAAAAWPFREVTRRKVGGGSKTSPADEITWTGSFNGRPIIFTTRPRLVTAQASFLVSSNARLRTSVLKRDESHFLDLCVQDRALSMTERAELAALAGAQDRSRPVRVRETGEPVRGEVPTEVESPGPNQQDNSGGGPVVQFTLL